MATGSGLNSVFRLAAHAGLAGKGDLKASMDPQAAFPILTRNDFPHCRQLILDEAEKIFRFTEYAFQVLRVASIPTAQRQARIAQVSDMMIADLRYFEASAVLGALALAADPDLAEGLMITSAELLASLLDFLQRIQSYQDPEDPNQENQRVLNKVKAKASSAMDIFAQVIRNMRAHQAEQSQTSASSPSINKPLVDGLLIHVKKSGTAVVHVLHSLLDRIARIDERLHRQATRLDAPGRRVSSVAAIALMRNRLLEQFSGSRTQLHQTSSTDLRTSVSSTKKEPLPETFYSIESNLPMYSDVRKSTSRRIFTFPMNAPPRQSFDARPPYTTEQMYPTLRMDQKPSTEGRPSMVTSPYATLRKASLPPSYASLARQIQELEALSPRASTTEPAYLCNSATRPTAPTFTPPPISGPTMVYMKREWEPGLFGRKLVQDPGETKWKVQYITLDASQLFVCYAVREGLALEHTFELRRAVLERATVYHRDSVLRLKLVNGIDVLIQFGSEEAYLVWWNLLSVAVRLK